ncbi:mitochondrial fission 1 protein isoform X4 [Haemorhous mexicanus]|uniref:mitochondrial fission 1 protein isoform X4 n=2 Tax=Haemorhous mexicanus TaxID=30427 RepID=UPI0028BD6DB6|nr:mitochondrial fission 1 protein isoform X4 [Haemorhous mexicanus]
MDPEFDDVVAVEDLMALERRYAAERQQGALSRQCRFEYGWGLVRSRYREDTARGVALLSELLPETPPEEQRDVLFYLALGYYRLKEYERALEHLEGGWGLRGCVPGHTGDPGDTQVAQVTHRWPR